MSSFLLGGRAWLVVAVDHAERLVRAKPAPRGKKPSWGGFVLQFLSREVCEEMRAVLVSDDDYLLAELRDLRLFEDPDTQRKILSRVPEYRLSKFQRVLPDALATDMIGAYPLDFLGARERLDVPCA